MTSNIHTAINAVMQGVGYVQKEKAKGLQYSFAGESALIQALRPSMVANEIYMYVSKISDVRREQYETKSGTSMTNTVITGRVTFHHAPSDTKIEVEATGEGSDAGDKSANKAMTGLYKYALRQTFMIETGDDPDKNPSEERKGKTELTEQEKKDKVIEQMDKLIKRAQAVKMEVPALDAGWDSAKMKAHYLEQYKFVQTAEEQAKAGE